MVSKKTTARMSTSYRFSRTKKGKRFNTYRPQKKNVHFFKRTFLRTQALTDVAFTQLTIPSGRSNDYRISDLPNYTDFTAMYDQYKICGIKHKFVFERNSSDVGATAASTMIPTLITVNDYNTPAGLSDENQALQYASCKQSRLDRVTSRYYKPVSDTAPVASGQSANPKRQWLNTSVIDHPHHGMICSVTTSGTSGTETLGVLKVYTTYYIACRSPR